MSYLIYVSSRKTEPVAAKMFPTETSWIFFYSSSAVSVFFLHCQLRHSNTHRDIHRLHGRERGGILSQRAIFSPSFTVSTSAVAQKSSRENRLLPFSTCPALALCSFLPSKWANNESAKNVIIDWRNSCLVRSLARSLTRSFSFACGRGCSDEDVEGRDEWLIDAAAAAACGALPFSQVIHGKKHLCRRSYGYSVGLHFLTHATTSTKMFLSRNFFPFKF